ncbi:MAG: hypothetical protein HY554_17870 [Elusimicrobia bacterium]|nr:hypothetical protein [Elusimicrobiota bacterium]
MYPNILVIRLSSLGDVALTVPVYRALKRHWPGCRIAVLVKPAWVSVLQGHPCVDEVIPFASLGSALSRIRSAGFTHLLDLHGTLRSRLLRWLSGVPVQLGYRKDALARRVFVTFGWASPALTRHTIDRYLECLEAWGVRSASRELTLGDARGGALAAAPSRVVVLQTAFIGDATLTVPLARSLKAAFPRSHLTLVTRPDCLDVFRAAPWIDELWAEDKGASGAFRRLTARLRAGRFDLAIVPHRSLRSALAVRLAGIRERVGFSASAGSWLFTRVIPFSWGMHDLERNLSLVLPVAGSAGQPPAPARAEGSVYLQPDPVARQTVEGRLSAAGARADARLIGLHPGSVWGTKRWPAARYAELARRLARDAGARPIVVGGRADAALCGEVAALAGAGALDWSGKSSLAELIALMPSLALFITNDSGPMHIAAASGVPTLAFFGPTTRELGFFPYGPRHRVLEKDLACRPCGLHGHHRCPHGHFLCMGLISVEEAYAAARAMLAEAEAPAAPERARA